MSWINNLSCCGIGQTCKQAFEQKCKKLCRVEKSTGPLDPVFNFFFFFHNKVVSFIALKKGKRDWGRKSEALLINISNTPRVKESLRL